MKFYLASLPLYVLYKCIYPQILSSHCSLNTLKFHILNLVSVSPNGLSTSLQEFLNLINKKNQQ